MRNYLMLLGWAPGGDREIVPWSVIEAEFRLEDVNPSPAFFDEKKLRAFNGEYIRALPVEEFIAACQPWLPAPTTGRRGTARPFDPNVFAAVAPLAQTRIAVLAEIVANVDFLFLDEPVIDEASWAKAMKDGAGELLDAATRRASTTVERGTPSRSRPRWRRSARRAGSSSARPRRPVRVAVTGRTVGPAAVRVARGAGPRARQGPDPRGAGPPRG